MHVIKVVDLVTRNSDQLSLYFSYFCMNLYLFYKFAGKTRKHKHRVAKGAPGTCTKPPGIIKQIENRPLAGDRAGEADGRLDSGAPGRRRRGTRGGFARGDRELPFGGLIGV